MTKLDTLSELIQRYKNWGEVGLSIVTKHKLAKVLLRDGIRLECNDKLLWLVTEVFFDRIYNPASLEIESDDIVVDIGAHQGIFSVFAASLTKNTVYAFEPFPDNYAILKRNILANKLHNIVAHRAAVSDKSGSTTLLTSSKSSMGHALSSRHMLETLERYETDVEHLQFQYALPGKFEGGLEVPTTTLADIMDSNHITRIGFLKMDCEGSEGLILAATPKNYLKRISKVALEFHDHLSQLGHNDIVELLEDAGFHTKLNWENMSPLGYVYGWRE